MQKRRQNRIQGGWASARSRSPTSRQRIEEKRTNADHFQKIKPSDQEYREAGSSGAGLQRKFIFQDEVKNEVKKNVSAEKVITKGGVYEISNTPAHGISRLEFYPDFISVDDAKWMFEQLHHEIPWEEKYIKLKGEFHKQPRLTAWFGDFPYKYSGLTLHPFQWSPFLDLLRDRIREKTGDTFNSMLANLYRDCKDSVDWHADDEESLGNYPTIASISFGDTRNFEMQMKKREGKNEDEQSSQSIKVPLPSGSLLIMRDAVQKDWLHRVPKEYHDRGPRINLTFRNIKPA